jgi:hypothetical protein
MGKVVECTCDQHPIYTGCCPLLEKYVNNCMTGLNYHSEERQVTVFLAHGMGRQVLSYCPWCGSKLPDSLFDTRIDILESEYKIDDPYDKKQKKLIPAEFLTDEWWKTRGL